jgi:hypothetical protein
MACPTYICDEKVATETSQMTPQFLSSLYT